MSRRGTIVAVGNTDERYGKLAPTKPKYGNRTTVYQGQVFDSAGEARYAQLLDWHLAAGTILKWRRGQTYVLLDAPKPRDRITFTPDFEVWPDPARPDVWEIRDFKGVVTEAFRMRAKLWKARYPDVPIVLVRADGKEQRL